MKRVLFVEDNSHKRTRVIECIASIDASIQVSQAWSFTSGCQKLDDAKYDLLLLDVSLPTYDKSGSESGGRFRTFGGREIARKVFRNDLDVKIAFITQFNSFSDKGNSYTFDDLENAISAELNGKFLGMIYYNSALSAWRDELAKILKEL